MLATDACVAHESTQCSSTGTQHGLQRCTACKDVHGWLHSPLVTLGRGLPSLGHKCMACVTPSASPSGTAAVMACKATLLLGHTHTRVVMAYAALAAARNLQKLARDLPCTSAVCCIVVYLAKLLATHGWQPQHKCHSNCSSNVELPNRHAHPMLMTCRAHPHLSRSSRSCPYTVLCRRSKGTSMLKLVPLNRSCSYTAGLCP
jgi:hypothetical protein